MRGAYGGTACIVIDVPQDEVLPYESSEGQHGYRWFAVPGGVANRYERRVLCTDGGHIGRNAPHRNPQGSLRNALSHRTDSGQ
jgi:hypothetical protein